MLINPPSSLLGTPLWLSVMQIVNQFHHLIKIDQDNLLKIKQSILMGKKDISEFTYQLGFSVISRVYRGWSEKEEISSKRQFGISVVTFRWQGQILSVSEKCFHHSPKFMSWQFWAQKELPILYLQGVPNKMSIRCILTFSLWLSIKRDPAIPLKMCVLLLHCFVTMMVKTNLSALSVLGPNFYSVLSSVLITFSCLHC